MPRLRQPVTVRGETFEPIPGGARQYRGPDGQAYSRRSIDLFRRSGRDLQSIKPEPASLRLYRLAERDYKRAEAQRRDMSAKDVRVRGASQSAERFREIFRRYISALKTDDDKGIIVSVYKLGRIDKVQAERSLVARGIEFTDEDFNEEREEE